MMEKTHARFCKASERHEILLQIMVYDLKVLCHFHHYLRNYHVSNRQSLVHDYYTINTIKFYYISPFISKTSNQRSQFLLANPTQPTTHHQPHVTSPVPKETSEGVGFWWLYQFLLQMSLCLVAGGSTLGSVNHALYPPTPRFLKRNATGNKQ